MKFLSFVLLLILTAACSLVAPSKRVPRANYYPQQDMGFSPIRKKIVVLDLYNESTTPTRDLALTATREIKNELNRSGQFVIDEDSGAAFGDSKEIFSGGGAKLSQLVIKARQLGVNLILFGRVIEAKIRQQTDEIGVFKKTDSYAKTEIELRLFDVHANKEIYVGKMNGNIKDRSSSFFLSQKSQKKRSKKEILRYSVRVAARRFIPPLIKVSQKLSWTGRVAKIIGAQIYLNAGRASGVFMGDILKVLTAGVEIYDPESGEILGVSKGEVKGTLEVVDFIGVDGSIAILHSGGSVTEGDFIQLYQ